MLSVSTSWRCWPPGIFGTGYVKAIAALLLFLLLIMGINGMVMTRDMFNLFVFLEIVSIATYGLLGFDGTPAALAAGFKYILATVIASTFFLLGAALLYHVTGTLNIDDMIAHRAQIAGPIGTTALLLVLSCLIIELKPFPANGWGLDVYQSASSGVAALVSGAVSAGVFFALFKLLPLFESYLTLIAVSGGATFLFSNLAGLRQTNVQRMLGYSSIAQMGLLTLALALMRHLGADASMPLVVGGLFINHLLAKAGLFFLAGAVNRRKIDSWSAIAGRPLILLIFAVLLVAIAGLPPFPGFWSKWELVISVATAGQYAWIAVILVGSLFEVAYMFRWFKQATRAAPEQGTARCPTWPPSAGWTVCGASLRFGLRGGKSLGRGLALDICAAGCRSLSLPVRLASRSVQINAHAHTWCFCLASGLLVRSRASAASSRCFSFQAGWLSRRPASIARTRGPATIR